MTAARHIEEEPLALAPMVLKHVWKGLLPFLAVTAAVLGCSLLWPRTYQAEAIFEIRNELSMHEMLGQKLAGIDPELKQTLVQDLSGRLAVERVIDDLQLIGPPAAGAEGDGEIAASVPAAHYAAQRRMLAQELAPAIRVHLDLATPDVQRIRVTVESDNAARARDIANCLVENYIKQGHREAMETIGDRESFLQDQANGYAEELAAAVGKLTAFEIEHPSPAVISPTRWQELHVQAAWKVMSAQTRRDAAQQHIEELTEQVGPEPRESAAGPVVDEAERTRLQRMLYTCRDQLDTALNLHSLGAEHRKVRALESQIQQIEQRLRAMPPRAAELIAAENLDLDPAAAWAQARQELAIATAELRIAQEHAATLKAESVRLAPVAQEHRRLKREVEAVQANLGFWEKHLLEAGRSLGEEFVRHQGAMTFLSPAAEMLLPASPVRRQVILTALLCGLAAGALWVYFAMQKDQSYRLMEHAEQNLPIPVLGELALDNPQPLAARMWQLGVWRPIGAGMATVLIALLLNLNMARLSEPGQPDRPDSNGRSAHEHHPVDPPVAGELPDPPSGS